MRGCQICFQGGAEQVVTSVKDQSTRPCIPLDSWVGPVVLDSKADIGHAGGESKAGGDVLLGVDTIKGWLDAGARIVILEGTAGLGRTMDMA